MTYSRGVAAARNQKRILVVIPTSTLTQRQPPPAETGAGAGLHPCQGIRFADVSPERSEPRKRWLQGCLPAGGYDRRPFAHLRTEGV